MTRDEARKAAEVMLAYADGKEIMEIIRDDPKDCWEVNEPSFDWDNFDYRIKPEPKYRPFKDAEECWQEMQKHQPFGWVKADYTNNYFNIVGFLSHDEYSLRVFDMKISFENAYRNYLFADGTPFGVKEGEA